MDMAEPQESGPSEVRGISGLKRLGLGEGQPGKANA